VPLTVASANVNGLRAAVRRGLPRWLESVQPDVLTLQEVRCPDDLVVELLGDGWHVVHSECQERGRAGVAVAARRPFTSSAGEIGHPAFEGAGRWAEADLPTRDGCSLTVVSAYVHTGDAADERRMAQKHHFFELLTARIEALRHAGRHVLLTGDLNVAHKEVDLRNWRGNRGRAGFLPEERAHLDRLFDELGWVDLGRRFGGWGPGPYTWWSYRGRSYDNDVGWRIDYQIASPDLAAAAKDAFVDRAPTHPERWSDHAPLVATFDLDLAGPV
jgi:exodeoxyribonuclease-3